MAKTYTDAQNLENFLNREIATSYEGQIEEWIEEASAFIDNYTGTTFDSETDVTKTYDGNGRGVLFVDDFQSIDDVTVAGTSVSYETGGDPIYKIKREDGDFTEGFQNVEVTGTYGYSETPPADIRNACTVIAAGLITKDGAKESESIDGMKVSYTDEKGLAGYRNALRTLERYSK